MALNTELFRVIHGFAHQSPFIDGFGIFLASYLPWLIVVAAVIFAALGASTHERLYRAALISVSVLVAWGVLRPLIGEIIDSPRPPIALEDVQPLIAHAPTPSFPSGHATFLFAVAGAAFIARRRWGAWLGVLAAVVAVARVFVGVHFPLDVVGGAVLGLGVAFIASKLIPGPASST